MTVVLVLILFACIVAMLTAEYRRRRQQRQEDARRIQRVRMRARAEAFRLEADERLARRGDCPWPDATADRSQETSCGGY